MLGRNDTAIFVSQSREAAAGAASTGGRPSIPFRKAARDRHANEAAMTQELTSADAEMRFVRFR